MILLWLALFWFAAASLLIARAFRQRNAVPALKTDTEIAAAQPCVRLVIPARNESANIAACLASFAEQRSVRMQILVVDDHSSDGTADIVAGMCEGNEDRMSLMPAPPLPRRWTGKSSACWAGAETTRGEPGWLLFVDADVKAIDRDAVAKAVAAAEAEEVSLLSLAPRHELRTFAERIVIPCGLFLQAFLQDFSSGANPGRPEAYAAGQFMLFRREAYEAVGGHAAVRSEICEDAALARLLKRHGERVVLHDGSQLLEVRMYDGWQTLKAGFAKNLVEMIGGRRKTVAVILSAILLGWMAFALPAIGAAGCLAGNMTACAATVPATMATLAMLALHSVGAAYLGVPFWYGLLFPLGYSAGALIAFESLTWRIAGRVEWKGRTYG
jgi:chlorobactene glucosyltransferase